MSPSQWVRENPDEALTVSNGRLFCSTCHEELSLKSSSIRNHVNSSKHQSRKKRHKSTEVHEHDIAQALVKYRHVKGETLPANVQACRIKVVTAFLRADIMNLYNCY